MAARQSLHDERLCAFQSNFQFRWGKYLFAPHYRFFALSDSLKRQFPEYKIDNFYKPILTHCFLRDSENFEVPALTHQARSDFKCFNYKDWSFDALSALMQLKMDENGNLTSTLYERKINNSGFMKLKVNCKQPGRLTVMFAEVVPAGLWIMILPIRNILRKIIFIF